MSDFLAFESGIFCVKTDLGYGTAFVIYVENKQFLITVAHLFEKEYFFTYDAGFSIPENYSLYYLSVNTKSGKIIENEIRGIGYILKNSDICIIQTEPIIQTWHESSLVHLKLGYKESNITISIPSRYSQGHEFIYFGFPYNRFSLLRTGYDTSNSDDGIGMPMPLIKKGMLMNMNLSDTLHNPTPYLLDTINNKGFSGGPVVLAQNNQIKIVGIVSSKMYRIHALQHSFSSINLTSEQLNKQLKEENLQDDLGIMNFYSIWHAEKAILEKFINL